MRTKKILALFLATLMVIASLGSSALAKAEGVGKSYVEIIEDEAKVWELVPGAKTTVVLKIKATSAYINTPTITVKAVEDGTLFSISKPKIYSDTVPTGVYAINTHGTTYLEFDISTKDNATIKGYSFNITFGFEDAFTGETVTDTITMNARVTKEKSPAQLSISNVRYNEDAAAIGNSFDVTFDVKNEGELAALNTYLTMNYGETGIVAGYSAWDVKVGDLLAGQSKSVTLTMKVLPTATEGLKYLSAAFRYKDASGKEDKSEKGLHITVKKTSTQASKDAKLIVNSSVVNNEVAAGKEHSLLGEINNIGKTKAQNVEVSIIAGTGVSSGIISMSDTPILVLADIEADGSKQFKLPIMVTDSAAAGLTELTVQVSYTDSEGNVKSAVAPFYLTVIKTETAVDDGEVVISNVSQYPSEPLVGQKVTVTFEVENRSSKAITAVKVGGDNLSSAGFEPYTALADQEIGTIEAKSKKLVSLDFKVGANIAEGMNTLTLSCEYKDTSGNKQKKSTDVYILNVVNDSNSKPRVIVSDFTKDSEELKAGSTFNFTYILKNTHASKAAKNIKVTITQAENVFSATQGTNSFFIDRIDAGEEVERSIELKVKADVTTAAYELEIKVEYEYDGMSKLDQDNGGVTESNKVKLQAVENLRPSVQNLNVGMYGELPMVNASTLLNFEFINMGKSPLNNVRFSLEGDFILETGASFFHGTVTPGMPEYIEMSVMPTMAGMCSGTLLMTFEDSNGDEVVMRHEFSNINVMEQMSFEDWNNGMDPGFPVFEETPQAVKKDILPVWVFVLIQVGVLAIFIPVIRLIIIKVHIIRLRKKEELSNY